MRVERGRHIVPSFPLQSGAVLPEAVAGYSCYGTLNAERNNAILLCHYFTGSSHAAGRLQPDDPVPGYWDAVIGPGKALDTDRYCIVAPDALCNANALDPNTHTSGPASINPASGRPYGTDFPLISVGDMAALHREVLRHLDIQGLVAVVGPSGGSAQALEFAVRYPELSPRVCAVIPPGLDMPIFSRTFQGIILDEIRLDPDWQDGHYPLDRQPRTGLRQAIRWLTMLCLQHGWADRSLPAGSSGSGADPELRLADSFASDARVVAMVEQRLRHLDANHILYATRAYQNYSIRDRLDRLRARVLFIPARQDILFPPSVSQAAVDTLRAHGVAADLVVLEGDGGHLDGLARIGDVADVLRDFLSS